MIKAALFLTCLATTAHAESLSQADVVQGILRSGWQTESGSHITALHLALAPNWKTYWRAPGDAGIPPVFDWAGSTNLRSVRFLWPAPEVFHINGMQSVGYHHELVLPIEVEAIDPSRPVELRAEVELGVCRDICMPATLSLAASLSPPGKPDKVIANALKARPATAGEAGASQINCDIEPIRDGLRVTARMTLPQQGGDEVVVMEPGIPGVWVSEAEVTRKGAELVAVSDMVPPSGEPFTLIRDNILLTVIGAPGQAVEIRGCPAG